MVRNRHLSKSISDASWGTFLRWVKYYAAVHDIPVIAVPPQFTTQECSACGTQVKKSLSVRTHICPTCGHREISEHSENASSGESVRKLNQLPWQDIDGDRRIAG